MPYPVGTVITLGEEEIFFESNLAAGLTFSGACWKAAVLKPNGDFTKVCGETGETAPCTFTASFTSGEVWEYTLPCTQIVMNQASLEKLGGTFILRKGSQKKRIA